MMSKKKALSVVLATLCVAAATAGCGKVNIGYVDETKIQTEAPQIKASMEEMQQKMTELQANAEKQFQDAQARNASEEEMQKLQQQIQMQAMGIKQQYGTQMKSKVDAAMDDVVKAKELDVVLNSTGRDGVVVSGGTDITEEVIQKLR